MAEMDVAANATAEVLAATQPAEESADVKQQEVAEESADVKQQEVAEEVTEAKCRRCGVDVKVEDAVCMPKYRLELRYSCKACHALHTQLSRHNVNLASLLNENETVAFFQEAKAQRLQGTDSRLHYGDARALLTQKMVSRTAPGFQWAC